MAGPAAAALARTDARDSGAESIAPTSSAARELPGSPPSSGERQLSREHRASRVGGALPWRPAPLGHGTLCETLGLCARGGAECRAAPAGAVGSPMGLSKSKHKSRKGEEKKKGRGSSTAKTKERSMDRRSQETESPPDTKAAESCQGKKGAAKRQWPSSSEVEGAQRIVKRGCAGYTAHSPILQRPADPNSTVEGYFSLEHSRVRRDVGAPAWARGSKGLECWWDKGVEQFGKFIHFVCSPG
ncbi:spermatogenesis-associated protein 33 isoform X1 [Phoca vitulina]|uniref:spermatogenesis-associated protein 33 isoform X1 n=1 Tax=Phoca vitulina TaxID=9720 RepID=UPI001395F7A1|nr:spermatogenesis-associated protein 33 isoform X1 [Phoca vitulina]